MRKFVLLLLLVTTLLPCLFARYNHFTRIEPPKDKQWPDQNQKTSGADYKAEKLATTSSANGQAFIKVRVNGIGIPDAIKENIMQPFFTTKPTGEGTGLGLPLTYDMVAKGHGGAYRLAVLKPRGPSLLFHCLLVNTYSIA